jgi:uncharacterized protein (DUF1330 family)
MSAYIIIHNTVLDPDAMQQYIPKAVETFAPHAVELKVLEESSTVLEGQCDHPRTILLKFESRERAEAWYNSPEYQEALPIRLGATKGFAVLVDEFAG